MVPGGLSLEKVTNSYAGDCSYGKTERQKKPTLTFSEELLHLAVTNSVSGVSQRLRTPLWRREFGR